ncbi:cupin domain-containing protein [Rodentibacter caecimuris]|uniref:cupin domain-containing protein n=1 Tax=Rodentibacter caecimuris TaxID=1796644 RepID=UPI001094DF5D|nr:MULTISPECIES: AraC family transcriptional regulator [Pasteurellaceae]MCX2961959.1 AraC family transcriptional regulator [Rodentibacter heylii]QIA77597.1 AraC family transcriptional regulator [Rodentibacter heylii]TGY47946.1 AraC family transcriptional regulator [Pasteurella caecimuris]
MDYLDKLIRLAQVRGEINIRCQFQGNWLVSHDERADSKGIFHLIEEGECWLTLGEIRFHLKQGDIFFLPQNRPHLMQHLTEKMDLSALNKVQQGTFELHQIGQGTPNLKMFCGTFYYQKNALLTASLPPYLHLNLNDTPIHPLIRLFLQEAAQQESGNQSVIDALANVLFIYILRHALSVGLIGQGILFALQDKRLNAVLMKLLQSPEQDWHVERLAELASMSRSNFIRVFQQQVGMSPGRFLTKVRLDLAAFLLKQTQQSILSIALDVGYQSEAHFSKAFKLAYTLSPSQYRKL